MSKCLKTYDIFIEDNCIAAEVPLEYISTIVGSLIDYISKSQDQSSIFDETMVSVRRHKNFSTLDLEVGGKQ